MVDYTGLYGLLGEDLVEAKDLELLDLSEGCGDPIMGRMDL